MEFQATQAVFLPFPKKEDVVSQPVRAWKAGSADDFAGPSWAAMVWTGIYLYRRCIPNATQSSSTFWPRETKPETASTTTSLSVVLTINFLWPQEAAAATWRNILESASSCEQGDRALTSESSGELEHLSRIVKKSCFPFGSCKSFNWLAISMKSSCLDWDEYFF